MTLFNVDIRHKPKKDNVVLDVLSQKHQLRMWERRNSKRKFD